MKKLISLLLALLLSLSTLSAWAENADLAPTFDLDVQTRPRSTRWCPPPG